MTIWRLLAAGAAAVCLAHAAWAQSPAAGKPLRWIVPFAAGGPLDTRLGISLD